MKVFITWSGELSRTVSEVLRTWIPSTLQAVKPYFSPEDAAKGGRWFTDIESNIAQSKVGLICLTRDNLNAPWLLFEAGALGKGLSRSSVCPILFDGVEPTDVKGPLAQFQAARFERSEILRTVKMINSKLEDDNRLPDPVLGSVFEKWWPDLERGVTRCTSNQPDRNLGEARSERDILEEVLALTRRVASGQSSARDTVDEDLYVIQNHANRLRQSLVDPSKETRTFMAELQLLIAIARGDDATWKPTQLHSLARDHRKAQLSSLTTNESMRHSRHPED